MSLLEEILQPENLHQAWEEVARNDGAPGSDEISITRWSRNWEERLSDLAYSVRRGTYRPAKPRRFKIPKADGSPRELSILTVTDRVLQRACLRVLDDRFDRAFLDCSFGYRQGIGLRGAVPAILAHRDAGRVWVFDADIDECFPSLDHQLILSFFAETVSDPPLLRLLESWLKAGAVDKDGRKGILMGAVISPLLCNIVLHRLDLGLVSAGFGLVRYADDFCVFCSDQPQANQAWYAAEEILSGLKLRLEPRKTRLSNFADGFDFLGIHFQQNAYRYKWKDKQIEVQGGFDIQMFDVYVPPGYG